MDKSGVYKITNEITGRFYIGSSIHVEQRFYTHKKELRANEHINPILQSSWNKHGEKSFSFRVIEECVPSECLSREQHYLDLLQPYKNVGYNIGKTANGGDNFTNHPDKEELREKMKIWYGGEGNGMFGKIHTLDSLVKLKSAAKGRFSLQWFIERNGEELGMQKYQERRQTLASRKINYKYDNGLKGKTRVVESTRGVSVSKGRAALKGRKEKFLVDISNPELSTKQIAEKYGISLAAVKYHRKKPPE